MTSDRAGVIVEETNTSCAVPRIADSIFGSVGVEGHAGVCGACAPGLDRIAGAVRSIYQFEWVTWLEKVEVKVEAYQSTSLGS